MRRTRNRSTKENVIILKFNNFRFRQKIAAFDYDWTLVKPKTGFTFPKNVNDWVWLRNNVPNILKSFYKRGYCLVIFTNQSKKMKIEQISLVLQSLKIPIMAVIGMNKNIHKPSPYMFNIIFSDKKIHSTSFYVGDALGRPGDWSDSDKKFGETIGLKVLSPEEVFPFKSKKKSQIIKQKNKLKN